MKVAIIEKAPKLKGFETGEIVRYDLDKNEDFDAFCSDLISIGNVRSQKFIKIVTENKHELDFEV
jgi:hypothetical protein